MLESISNDLIDSMDQIIKQERRKNTMKNKKKFVKDYLSTRVDFEAMKKEYANAWLSNKPKSWFYGDGIIPKYFTIDLIREATEKAGYKYSESDTTWLTILDIEWELINEYVL